MLLFFSTFSFLIGLIIGSFTNCFIWRLHENESLWNRSYCPKCRHKIFWYDNIPILSFFLLGGRCRKCRKKISWQYPLVEFGTAYLFALSFCVVTKQLATAEVSYNDLSLFADNKFILTLARDWLIIFTAAVVFVYDWRWYLVSDRAIIPASLSVLLFNLFLGLSWWGLLFSAVAGGGFFLLQFLVSSGRWVGGGDIRLGIFAGLAAGNVYELILTLVLTYFIGAVFSLGLLATKKKEWNSKVPLGVFMMPAVIITMLWGREIIVWYSSIF